MKKIFFSSIILAITATACKKEKTQESALDKNKFEAEFYSGCIQAIKNSGSELYNEELAAEYCSCVIKTVLPELSEEEKTQISSTNNTEVQVKINNLVQPCLENYLSKIESLE